MAGTIILGQFADGAVSIEMDYDDAMNVASLRGSNSTDQPAFALLRGIDENGTPTGVQFGLDCVAGQNSIISIPKGKTGIQLALPSGAGFMNKRFGGYSVDLRFPL